MVVQGEAFKIWQIPEGSAHAGRIGIGLTSRFHKKVKALPGTLFSKGDDVWTVSKTYPSALMLGALAREIRVPIRPTADLAAWVKAEKADWTALAELAAVVMVPEADQADGMFRHQVADVDWLVFGGGPVGRLLLNEMGVGKTRSTLVGLQVLDAFPALVICPKAVMVKGWVTEIEEVLPDRTVLAPRTPAQRRKALAATLDGKADVLVMGYEAMRAHTRYAPYGSVALKRCPACGGPKAGDEVVSAAKCQAHEKELNAIPWRAVIADEVHRALTATSQTRMSLAGVVRSAPVGAKRWALTGTPVSKRPDGLWSLLNYVDEVAWPVKSDWVDRFCEQGFDGGGYWVTTGFKADREKELRASLDAITRRVLKLQVLDLPEMMRGGSLVHEVEMGTEQRKAYDAMRDTMILQVKEGTVTAKDARVLAGRLTLLSSATGIPGDEPGQMFLRLPSAKVDELIEMIKQEELGQQFALAFTSQRFLRLTVQELVRRELFTENEIGIIDGPTPADERDRAVGAFQAGKIPVVCYTHSAGGTGITLHAAETLVLMERAWSPILMSQSLARVHRAGMPDRPVAVVDMITVGTIETKQNLRLEQDADLLEAVVHDKEKLLAMLAAG
jgi:SNF2 family DNA or RNA helicase